MSEKAVQDRYAPNSICFGCKANAMKKLDEAKSEGLVDEGVIEVLTVIPLT